MESTQIVLLQSVVKLFASPDGYAGPSVQAAIALSSDTFSSVWQSADGYAYGVTFNEIVDLSRIGPEGDLTGGMWKYQLIAWCVIFIFIYLFIFKVFIRPDYLPLGSETDFGCL